MADEQVTTPNAPGNVVYPLTDQEGTIHDLAVATLNTPTGLMNTTVVNHIVYDAFGNVVSSMNPSKPQAPPQRSLASSATPAGRWTLPARVCKTTTTAGTAPRRCAG